MSDTGYYDQSYPPSLWETPPGDAPANEPDATPTTTRRRRSTSTPDEATPTT